MTSPHKSPFEHPLQKRQNVGLPISTAIPATIASHRKYNNNQRPQFARIGFRPSSTENR